MAGRNLDGDARKLRRLTGWNVGRRTGWPRKSIAVSPHHRNPSEASEGLTLSVEAGRKTIGQLFPLFPGARAGISAHKRGIDSGAIGGKCSIPLNDFAPPPRTHECAGEAQVLGTTCRWDCKIVW